MAEQASPSAHPITYASAGVDVEAGDRAVELMKAAVRRTERPEVLGGLGGFAGLFDASRLTGMQHPVLATSTDGVGTKVAIARALDRHDTIGIDLVAMVVDDIVVCGAEPLFMTDYIACGAVVPERIAAIVSGIADGCEQAGVALVGGETAEHPGLMEPDEYDCAGAATGVVERDALLGPHLVAPGDVALAVASSGLHANGYSLVRRVIAQSGRGLGDHVDELGRTLGEELLEPTRIYTKALLDLIASVPVHALSHVTGGGLAANLARVLPEGVRVSVDRSTWTPPPIFDLVRTWGAVPAADVERTLNMGVGFVVLLPASAAAQARGRLEAAGLASWALGEVEAESSRQRQPGDDVVRGAKGVVGGAVELVGAYA